MNRYELGFIGAGNMGSALARAAVRAVDPQKIAVTNRHLERAQALSERLGCVCEDNLTAAASSRFIVLGVKPQMMGELLSSLKDTLSRREDRFVLVSVAAGLTIQTVQAMAGGEYPVIRIMPNTPVSVGEGVILCARNRLVTDDELSAFTHALEGAGIVDGIDEKLIDAGSALSGCGPAFADLFIEALADGAVAAGLPRAAALRYAAQMLAGSAKLVLQSGEHPGALKDAVCSPGGSTIAGVRVLEERAFRGACMDAVLAAFEKTKELGRTNQ